MGSDRYQHLRDALAAGPTPGDWMSSGEVIEPGEPLFIATMAYSGDKRRIIARIENAVSGRPLDSEDLANASFIAAADPDTIRALLDERDQLHKLLTIARKYVEDEVVHLRNALKSSTE